MLRKREKNILPQTGRQVHEVAFGDHRLLPRQGQVHCPRVHHQFATERPEAPGTLAVQNQGQPSLYQKGLVKFLHLRLHMHQAGDANQFIPRVKVKPLWSEVL